ncbi:uncharacterized protein At1g15400 [Diospyros lotus]|uniref:uncharacterized protein At1g15400 n=1 Tax=Diospyros lotus TaxID=55363 RepID=UPI00224F4A9D|nr:uncharacterized protein At1g15400 [Diospyros lotus]
MEMEGLQRSAMSFRRQGSSGLVWDDRFLSGELNQVANPKKEEEAEDGGEDKLKVEVESKEPTRSEQRYHRTAKDVAPTIDPPSPKVSTCGFCTMFGKSHKPNKSAKRKPKFLK